MTRDNQNYSDDFESLDERALRQVSAHIESAALSDGFNKEMQERVEISAASEIELVDMSSIINFFNANGIATTYYGGGVKSEYFSLDMPRVMFPRLLDLERVLRLFEGLAEGAGDEDILEAIYRPTGSVEEVYKGEELLHLEEKGFKTLGGRVVDLDHTWVVEVDCIKGDNWVSAMEKFGREIGKKEVREWMWRFTIRMPVGHAAKLNVLAEKAITQ
ncbi:MAG: hypothetical protein ACKOW9_01335 [Candidatus Paceibacterota bacterium]